MKKFFLCLFFLLLLNSLFSAKFKDIYHHNYDYVERLVLVFEAKPEYVIQEETSNLKIIIYKANPNFSLQDETFSSNKVLKSISYKNDNDNLIINLHINKNDSRSFFFNDFELLSQQYKLVLDVFRYKEPIEPDVYISYADFYKSVEMPKISATFLAKADSLKKVIAGQDVSSQKIESKQVKKQKEDVKSAENKPVKTGEKRESKGIIEFFRTLNPLYWIPFFIVILILIISLIIHSHPQKKQTDEEVKPNYRGDKGFGTEEYRVNMVENMKNSGWGENEIAKELMISVEEVRDIIKKNAE